MSCAWSIRVNDHIYKRRRWVTFSISRQNMFLACEPKIREKCITCFYPYLAQAPVRVGTQSKCVADSVLRTKEMGKSGITITNPNDKTGIEKDGRIFSKAANECMILTFSGKIEGVRKAMLNWKSEILQTKYSTLMRGRQSYHPPEDKNIPAPIAVKILMDIIERNVGRTPDTFYQYLSSITQLMGIVDIKVPIVKFNKRQITGDGLDILANEDGDDITDLEISTEWKLSRNWLDNWYTMSSFMKNQEHGRLAGRSIASPNVLFRSFLIPFDKLMDKLLDLISDASAVKTGTVDKISKILEIIEKLGQDCDKSTETKDYSKWNELISITGLCQSLACLFDYCNCLDGNILLFLSTVAGMFQNK